MTEHEVLRNSATLFNYNLRSNAAGQLSLKAKWGFSLGCGLLGLLLLTGGILMAVFWAIDFWSAGHAAPNTDRSLFRLILILLGGGVAGIWMLLGTYSVLFDAASGFIEHRRALGLLHTKMLQGQLASVDFNIFTVPAGLVRCSLCVKGLERQNLDLGVQPQFTEPDALTLVKLGIWIAEHFTLPFHIRLDNRTALENLPEGEITALLRSTAGG